MNDQTLDLWSEFCELSLFSSKIKVRSSYLIFPEQILTTAETHFIPIHISLSFFWFSLEKLVGSERKQSVVTCVLLHLGVTQIAFQLRLFYFSPQRCFWMDIQKLLRMFQRLLHWARAISTGQTSLETLENDCSKILIKSKISCDTAWYVIYLRANNNGRFKRTYTVKDTLRMQDPAFTVKLP